MFYRVMKGIYQFAANLLSYIPAKYYRNRSTSDLVIAKSRRVNFFLKQCIYSTMKTEDTEVLGRHGAKPSKISVSQTVSIII